MDEELLWLDVGSKVPLAFTEPLVVEVVFTWTGTEELVEKLGSVVEKARLELDEGVLSFPGTEELKLPDAVRSFDGVDDGNCPDEPE